MPADAVLGPPSVLMNSGDVPFWYFVDPSVAVADYVNALGMNTAYPVDLGYRLSRI